MPFNNVTQAAMGPPATLPHNSPTSYSSIARGAAEVGGGAGASSTMSEPRDERLPPENAFPAPGGDYRRDPWQDNQTILPISESAGPGPIINGNMMSPAGPIMSDVQNAPTVNL